MKSAKAYIGTSGWKYAHWEGVFYPQELKKKDQFKYFASCFDTVELNNSFYRQPSLENFKNWNVQAPKGFVYTIKANRYFTHLKKLHVERKEIIASLTLCDALEEKLGVVLFQLPPKWNINIERLENFLKMLPAKGRYAFEFRNPGWYTDAVFKCLEKYNCAFCIYELAGHLSPIITTADFAYVRLHGPAEKYQGSYDRKALAKWCKLCKTMLDEQKDIYLYFDNDQAGYAAFNALELKKMMSDAAR